MSVPSLVAFVAKRQHFLTSIVATAFYNTTQHTVKVQEIPQYNSTGASGAEPSL